MRYPTAGSSSVTESQPFCENSPYGIALAHNGNLTNAEQLKRELFETDLRHINTGGGWHAHVCADTAHLVPCIFEYVYFARPDSIVNGVSVYKARLRMGEKLARKILRERPDHDIDVVIPIPDTSRTSALRLAPPVRHPNVYGIDMPSSTELVASSRSEREVEKLIGADWLIYQSLEDLIGCVVEENPILSEFDCSIFNGRYVTGDIDQRDLQKLEKTRTG